MPPVVAESAAAPLIHGVDFTSAPRRAKPITVATGRVAAAGRFVLQAIETHDTLAAFEAWLRRPGPWIGGFDFPFGLPREAVQDLGWPLDWPRLVAHCRGLGRSALREALDAHRSARPPGRKFCYRRGDAAAGSHSPLKLVNPPVALMFLEGAARLMQAGVTVPGMHAGDPDRIALEAYPGYAVRRMLGGRARASYKNDARSKQTAEQRAARERILRIAVAQGIDGVRLQVPASLARTLVEDPTGDRLDAVLCALHAAWGFMRRDRGYGLPDCLDPLEGWIVGVPAAGDGGPDDSGNIRP